MADKGNATGNPLPNYGILRGAKLISRDEIEQNKRKIHELELMFTLRSNVRGGAVS